MATSEALTKYYDCLKDSFNKIQLKDNKTALINAALRPKIREEFAKSKDLLISYLNYIQVFSLIYSDKFTNICINIFCPLFKENKLSSSDDESCGKNVASLIHNTVREIVKAKPELVDEYVHCLIKFFPNIYSDGHDTFINYLENSLETCSYIRGQPLTKLLAKILDRINPPPENIGTDEEKATAIKKSIQDSYKLIYERLDKLEKRQLDNVSAAILAAFTREFLISDNEDSLNYLVLYLCSTDEKLLDLFINLLWATFTNTDRPFEERRASVCFASSFMSRATFVELSKVHNYLETATIWCEEFLKEHGNEVVENRDSFKETNELFYALIHSILYIITQRYREMYEVDSIERLKKLDLDRFLESSLDPLEVCDIETVQRFREVATLYGISSLKPIDEVEHARKRRKSANDFAKRPLWKAPFRETNHSLPTHVRTLYRNYYDHRNFTIDRE